MTDTQLHSRRIVFHGLGALGVAAVLAGCGDDGGDDDDATGQESESPDTPTTKPTDKGSGGGGATPLATTDEIPVNGGIVLTDKKIVITQPTKGEFKAFTAVCTHQGCTVGSVSDGEISCPCHGSVYDAATGDNIGGPAPAPLSEIAITVKKDKIFEA